jgi:hypothetical protein
VNPYADGITNDGRPVFIPPGITIGEARAAFVNGLIGTEDFEEAVERALRAKAVRPIIIPRRPTPPPRRQAGS